MFTGIVETTTRAALVESGDSSIHLCLHKPPSFDDLQVGHSVAVNGVCLTVQDFDDHTMAFVVGAETLQITGWTKEFLREAPLNLERALLVGARLHGHWVTGHVDGMGELLSREPLGENWLLQFRVPDSVKPFVWVKGSVCIQGVSLTVNTWDGERLGVCLIPETWRRTQFSSLGVGASVCFEGDYLAKLASLQPTQQFSERWSPSSTGKEVSR